MLGLIVHPSPIQVLSLRCLLPPLSPALVLSSTHQLARQLAGFGRMTTESSVIVSLCEHLGRQKRELYCASRVRRARIVPAELDRGVSAAKMANTVAGDDTEGEFEVRPWSRAGHAADVLVGTPSELL